jgi:hypothetical protein
MLATAGAPAAWLPVTQSMPNGQDWAHAADPTDPIAPQVIGWLGTALIVAALLIAGLAGISALRRRGPFVLVVAAAVLTEVMILVQAVVAVAVSVNGQSADEPGLFFAYLVAVVLILPAALLLARAERNQFGSLVIVVGGLVLAVLVVRLQQLWGVPVG